MKWLWNFSRHCAGIFLHGQEQETHTHTHTQKCQAGQMIPRLTFKKSSTLLAYAGYKYHNKQCMHIQSCKCDFLTLKNKSLPPYCLSVCVCVRARMHAQARVYVCMYVYRVNISLKPKHNYMKKCS